MKKRVLVMDVECLPNYFMVGFKSVDTRKFRYFEQYEGHPLDVDAVRDILLAFTIVTFNGTGYDFPMVNTALQCVSNRRLKELSDVIIQSQMRDFEFYREYEVPKLRGVDHIDLKEPVPGVMISLKLYGARLHSKRLQDMPIEHDEWIQPEQFPIIRGYNDNDLDTTIDLWLKATDPKDNIIATRELLTEEYGIDMRSKSDAQCAEAMIKARVERALDQRVYPQKVPAGTRFKYKPPAFIKFRSVILQGVLDDVLNADFVVQKTGQVELPASLDRYINIGQSNYKMGIGGLHSSEQSQAVIASDTLLIRDRDVVSYYPSLILQCGLSPKSMGDHFQKVYKQFFERRMAAKKAGNKSVTQTLKIVMNGSFGKLGSKYSVLYSPDLLIQVTVTGQLAILMLIERMEGAGIPVVSANTDGIVMVCPTHLEPRMLEIVAQWERETGLETEETRYRALYSRDVNNYLALKDGGGYKAKGTLTLAGTMKNPDYDIVNVAVCEFLDKGVPLAQTILGSKDVRQFLRAQRVTGGAQLPTRMDMVDQWVETAPREWTMTHQGKTYTEKRKSRPAPRFLTTDAMYLGKVVRWYRSSTSNVCLERVSNRAKVAGSDNATPLMTLCEGMPADIDYGFYLTEANNLLRDIGAIKKERR